VELFTRLVGDGPVVVVLHGGPGAHHDYLLPQYDLLARRRALLYYDQRGGGRSPVARDVPVGWREHVADLDAIREQRGIERLALCGYSWGGLLAILYFLEYPQKVARLALVSPASITAEYRRQFEAEFARRMASPEVQRARETRALSPFELAVAGYFRDIRDARNLTPFRVTARTQQAVWNSLGDYDLRAQLRETVSRFPIPESLVLHGTYDPLPIAGSRELAEILGAPVVELPVGHCPHVEATAEFVAALDGFLPRT
jgi:proline iminopeptidase